jgi:hypothetical protein
MTSPSAFFLTTSLIVCLSAPLANAQGKKGGQHRHLGFPFFWHRDNRKWEFTIDRCL